MLRSTSIFDPQRLMQLAESRRDEYRDARPFPHIVIDDFAPADALHDILAEFPSPEDPEWFRFDGEREKKLASTDTDLMGPATARFLAELNGAHFIDFLGVLTGIDGLIPDPHFHGGGLHQIEPGGFLNIHADFNLHPLTRTERRLNLLLYLNEGWQSEWGGNLELWNEGMAACEASIEPVFNRCVVFTTTDTSFHGHPKPLKSPPGVTRKSLALYYYSVPKDAWAEVHNTLFQDPDKRPDRLADVARDWLPPAVARAAGKARNRWRSRA